MSMFFDLVTRIRFSSPFLLVICAPLMMAFLLNLWRNRTEKKMRLSDLQEVKKWTQGKKWPVSFRSLRIILMTIMCSVVGITWMGPKFLIPPSNSSVMQEQVQQFLFLLDLSGSMQGLEEMPSKEYPNGVEKFEAMRQAFSEFVQSETNARIGLILFSDEAFVVAYPTHDHLFLEKAILQENMMDTQTLSSPSGPQSFVPQAPSQVAHFSEGTSIANALDASVEVLDEDAAPLGGRAVILVTDLGDNPQGVVAAIARLLKANARVYVVGVEMDKSVADAVIQNFGIQGDVMLYSTESPQRLKDAFQDIGLRERAAIFSHKAPNTLVPFDLFTLCASGLFVLLTILAGASETLFFFVAPMPDKRKMTRTLFARYILRRSDP